MGQLRRAPPVRAPQQGSCHSFLLQTGVCLPKLTGGIEYDPSATVSGDRALMEVTEIK